MPVTTLAVLEKPKSDVSELKELVVPARGRKDLILENPATSPEALEFQPINFDGFTSNYVLAELYHAGLVEFDNTLEHSLSRFFKAALLSIDKNTLDTIRICLNSTRRTLISAMNVLNDVLRQQNHIDDEDLSNHLSVPKPIEILKLEPETPRAELIDYTSNDVTTILSSLTNIAYYFQECANEIKSRTQANSVPTACSRSVVEVLKELQERSEILRRALENESGKSNSQNDLKLSPVKEKHTNRKCAPISQVPIQKKSSPITAQPASSSKRKEKSNNRSSSSKKPSRRPIENAGATREKKRQNSLPAERSVTSRVQSYSKSVELAQPINSGRQLAKPLRSSEIPAVINPQNPEVKVAPADSSLVALRTSLMTIMRNCAEQTATQGTPPTPKMKKKIDHLANGRITLDAKVKAFAHSSDIQVGSAALLALQYIISEALDGKLSMQTLDKTIKALSSYSSAGACDSAQSVA